MAEYITEKTGDTSGFQKEISEVAQETTAGMHGITESLATVKSSLEEVSGSVGTFGTEMVAQLSDIRAACGAVTDAMSGMNQVQYTDLTGALEAIKQHMETDVLQPISNEMMPIISQVTGFALDTFAQLADAYKTSGLTGMIRDASGIVAQLVETIAAYAPEMIDVAVKLIKSLIQGVTSHASELFAAAQSIVSVLVDGLMELLPKRIRVPVQEAIAALKQSFENGGLHTAVQVVGTLLSNLGEIAVKLATGMLPPLTSAIDFLGRNLNIIIPIVTSVTAALAAKEVIAGVLAAKIAVVTAAQLLWNAAMSANPIGLVIIAITSFVAATVALSLAFEDQISGEERLANSTAALSDSFGDVGEAAVAFYEGIQNAESHLSAFNDSLFASSEEQQKLKDNMQEVQDGITSICRTATEERRDYTQAEIEQLDEYFQKLAELSQQQFDLEQSKAEAVRQQAETTAEMHKGSLTEYQEVAQEWIKTSQEQYEVQKQLAEEAAINEIALLNQKYDQKSERESKAYQEEYDAILARKEQNIAAAQEEVGAVTAAFAEGYVQRSEDLEDFLEASEEYRLREQEEKNNHNAKMEELEELHNEVMEKGVVDSWITESVVNDMIEKENNRHAQELAGIQDELISNLDESTKEQLGNWMTMLAQTKQYGGDIPWETQQMVDEMIQTFDSLPEETKETMKNVMDPMLQEMENAEPGLYGKARAIATGVLERLRSSFDICSPSKKTRKIFRQVMQGAEIGLEDETPALMKQTSSLAENVLQRFQKTRLNVSGLVEQMRNAVSSQMKWIVAPAAASAAQTSVQFAYAYAGESGYTGVVHHVEIPVNLDGREIARASAEYTDSELGEIKRRKERGG